MDNCSDIYNAPIVRIARVHIQRKLQRKFKKINPKEQQAEPMALVKLN